MYGIWYDDCYIAEIQADEKIDIYVEFSLLINVDRCCDAYLTQMVLQSP